MNRAWIPAGALATVSAAGLIALGPLTSSLNTTVTFSDKVAVTTPAPSRSAVPVSFAAPVVGKTTHASVGTRGGPATTQQTPTSGDAGQVSVRVKSAPSVQAPVASPPSTPATPATPKPKRPTSIGAVSSGSNGDAGLAAGGKGSGPAHGGQQPSLGAENP